MNKISDKIFKNTIFNALGNIFTTGIQIVIIPYILLKLGTERFGIWALVSVIFGIFTALDFGTGNAFVKYFSEYYIKKEYENFNKALVAGFFFMLIFSLFLIFIVILLKSELINFFNIPLHLTSESIFVFVTAAIIFGLNNTFGVFQAIIKGLQRMEITNCINVICSIIYVIGVFVVLRYGYGLKGLIVNQGIKIVLVSMASIFYSKKIFKSLKFRLNYFNFKQVKMILSYGIKMQISSIANLVNLQTDKTIIGYFLNLSLVAAYEIDQKISLFSQMILGLALSALVPAVSELDASGKKESILKLYERGNKYIACFTFPVLVFLIAFTNLIINLWMGIGYEKSIFVARLLMCAVFINLLTGVGVMIVRGIGKPFYETSYALISLVFNIFLGVILVKSYGFSGVIIATPISVIIGSIYFIYQFHRLYSFSFIELATRIYLKPFLISFLGIGILYSLNFIIARQVLLETRFEFFILMVMNCVIFFPAVVWSLKKARYWDEEDRVLILEKVKFNPKIFKLASAIL